MSYPFPPPEPLNPGAVVLHVILLGIISVSMAGLWRQRRSQRRSFSLVPWGLALLIVAAFLFASTAGARTQPFWQLSMGVIAVLGLIGRNQSRRGGERQRRIATGWLTGMTLILGLLVTVPMLPATASAQDAARRTQCRNNLNGILRMMHEGLAASGRFPDATTSTVGGPPISWRIRLLDYAEAVSLKNPYDEGDTWNSDANLPAAQEQVPLYSCPSNYAPVDSKGRHYTAYALMVGNDAGFPEGRGLLLGDIESSSTTIAVAETCGQGIIWTEPRDVPTGQQPSGVNLPGSEPHTSGGWLSSYHDGGAHVGLFDGSVQFFHEGIDSGILRSLVTRDSSDDAGNGW